MKTTFYGPTVTVYTNKTLAVVSLCCFRDLQGGTALELATRVTHERTVTRKGTSGGRAREEVADAAADALQQGRGGYMGS